MVSKQSEEVWLKGADGTSLFTQRWEATTPRADVALAHGLSEHSGRYAHVADFLTADDFNVHAIDHRGHGRSGGRRGHIDEFEDYLRDMDVFVAAVQDRAEGRPVFLIGHSMGGLISTLFVISRDSSINGLILSGPAFALGNNIPASVSVAARFLGRVMPGCPIPGGNSRLVSRDKQVCANYASDPLVHHGPYRAGFARILLDAQAHVAHRLEEVEVPVLALHGTDDKLASADGSRKLIERARSADKSLKLYDGLYHEIFNEPEKREVFADVTSWMAKRI